MKKFLGGTTASRRDLRTEAVQVLKLSTNPKALTTPDDLGVIIKDFINSEAFKKQTVDSEGKVVTDSEILGSVYNLEMDGILIKILPTQAQLVEIVKEIQECFNEFRVLFSGLSSSVGDFVTSVEYNLYRSDLQGIYTKKNRFDKLHKELTEIREKYVAYAGEKKIEITESVSKEKNLEEEKTCKVEDISLFISNFRSSEAGLKYMLGDDVRRDLSLIDHYLKFLADNTKALEEEESWTRFKEKVDKIKADLLKLEPSDQCESQHLLKAIDLLRFELSKLEGNEPEQFLAMLASQVKKITQDVYKNINSLHADNKDVQLIKEFLREFAIYRDRLAQIVVLPPEQPDEKQNKDKLKGKSVSNLLKRLNTLISEMQIFIPKIQSLSDLFSDKFISWKDSDFILTRTECREDKDKDKDKEKTNSEQEFLKRRKKIDFSQVLALAGESKYSNTFLEPCFQIYFADLDFRASYVKTLKAQAGGEGKEEFMELVVKALLLKQAFTIFSQRTAKKEASLKENLESLKNFQESIKHLSEIFSKHEKSLDKWLSSVKSNKKHVYDTAFTQHAEQLKQVTVSVLRRKDLMGPAMREHRRVVSELTLRKVSILTTDTGTLPTATPTLAAAPAASVATAPVPPPSLSQVRAAAEARAKAEAERLAQTGGTTTQQM
jgi:hypothetical protein